MAEHGTAFRSVDAFHAGHGLGHAQFTSCDLKGERGRERQASIRPFTAPTLHVTHHAVPPWIVRNEAHGTASKVMNSAGGSNVIVPGQALGRPSFVDQFDGMAGVDKVPEDLVAHAWVAVAHAHQHRTVVVSLAQGVNKVTHVVRSVQLLGPFLTSINGPHHARARPWIDTDHDPALTRALNAPSQCLGQIGLEVVCSEAGGAVLRLVNGGQHHLHVVGHGFAGFEVARTMPTFTEEDKHPVHPREISASHADSCHASATRLRDLKHVLSP